MSRRVVFLIALISLAVLGVAAAPWTLTGDGLSTAVTEHMRDRYGVELKVEGRSTFALLPIPRVKFENVALHLPNQALKAEDGTLRGELRLLPLVIGRIELSDISLSDARISGSLRALQAMDWAAILKNRPGAAAHRLIVTGSSLHWTDAEDAGLDRLNLAASWAGTGEPLTLTASARWRDEMVSVEQASLDPVLLASGRLSPVTLSVSAPSGSISVTGEAQLGGDPQITGESAIEARSVRNFTRWSGIELPFGPLVQALSIKGDFSMNRRRLSWPSVAVTLGADKLEGTMAVRFDVERPLITGTLAADNLNLSDLFRPFAEARTPSGGWSEEAIDLTRETGSNLDLRLSATTAEIGRLRLDDMAASVLVRPGRIEASIGRAGFHSGTLKGRLSLTALDDLVEFKSQGTFSGVDMAPFLGAIGQPRWLTGRGQGQFQFEGSGRSPAQVVRQAQGHSSITVTDGDLIGLSLNDALRRVEKRPLLASLNWKGGRTSFAEAHLQVAIKDGQGEVSESHLITPELTADFHGLLSFAERTLNLKALVSPVNAGSSPSPIIEFDVSGDWDNIAVTPDARSLIERSGAAKPLFGSERVPDSKPPPQATAH